MSFLWDVEGEVMRVRSGKERGKDWGLYQRENGKRTCSTWHFGNSEPSISRADHTFSTPRTCDQQRRESWLFVTSSHSQTLIWILLLNRLRLNILTKTYTVERKIVCTTGNKDAFIGDTLWMGNFLDFLRSSMCTPMFRKVQEFSSWAFQKQQRPRPQAVNPR